MVRVDFHTWNEYSGFSYVDEFETLEFDESAEDYIKAVVKSGNDDELHEYLKFCDNVQVTLTDTETDEVVSSCWLKEALEKGV